MKKTIFKTIASTMLLAIFMSLFLLNGCKKNVSDVYEFKPVVLAPDFDIFNVGYTVNNGELNSASELTFNVTYKNMEVTESTYSSVLNFYVDGVIQQSVSLKDMAAGTNYTNSFKWQALAGKHVFKFEINLTSEGTKVIEEANVANNSRSTTLDIAPKALTVVQEVKVTPAVATAAINADTQSNVVGELASQGLKIATTVEPVKTTFDDKTSVIVAAVAKADGTIDQTKAVVSFTANPGASQGNRQESKTSIIVETKVAEKEVSFYNANEKLTYRDGVISFDMLKSASMAAACTELSDMQLFYSSVQAISSFVTRISQLINQVGVEQALNRMPITFIEVVIAYNFTQGNIDNPPIYYYEVLPSTSKTDECVDKKTVQVFGFPGFKLTFVDDRGEGVSLANGTEVFSTYEKQPSNTSNNGTYKFKDCGGNEVTYTFNGTRVVIETNTPCVPDVHNVN